MKSKFNKSWMSSRQPRKQIKFRANAPNHIKRKFLSAALDKPLRQKHKRRSIEVRKGDEVKIMKGKFKKKTGKVSTIDLKNSRVQIDGVQRSKRAGEKLETWFHPSNLKIISLEDSDAKRMKSKSTQKTNEPKKETKAESADKKIDEKKKTKKPTKESK